MKLLSLVVAALAMSLSGCQSVSDATSAMRERIGPRDESKTKVYAAQPRATYEAVRTAAASMGYKFVRGGPAQGEFEALSGLLPGDTIGSARQIAMKVKLRATLDGKGTEVTVRLGEIIERDSSNRAGMATESALRDTPQYEVLFMRVGKELGVPVEEAAVR